MRVSPVSGRALWRGQALLEVALVLPLVLLTMLAAMQLTLLVHARLRLEFALAAAARTFQVYGTTDRARIAAAYALAPASPRLVAVLGENGLPLADAFTTGPLAAMAGGIGRFVYAFAHTHVEACAARRDGDSSVLVVERGDPVRIELWFDAPLLLPFAARLISDGDDPARSDSAGAALAVTPAGNFLPASVNKHIDEQFDRLPKRRLAGRTAILWTAARAEPEPLALCVG